MVKIMVVDDMEEIVYITKRLLLKYGYEVIEAYSGEECLRLVEKEKPQLILLDIMMPGIDGWEVCRQIKENRKTRHIKVCMLSVRDEPQDIKKSLEYACADEHLGKQVKEDMLIEAIKRLL